MPDTINLPESAFAKLRRADKHINDLNGLIGSFLNQCPFYLVRRFDPNTGYLSLSVKQKIPVPEEIPLTLGDAIHNLRAMLDHTYFAVISAHTTRRDNIQFPIYRPDNKKDVLGRRLIKLTTKKVAEAINDCQPEPGGRYGIYELDAMDVEDKHRLIIVVGKSAGIPVNTVNLILPEMPIRMAGASLIQFNVEGDELINVPLNPAHPTAKRGAFEEKVSIGTTFGLFFGWGTRFWGPVIPSMIGIRNAVANAATEVWNASLI